MSSHRKRSVSEVRGRGELFVTFVERSIEGRLVLTTSTWFLLRQLPRSRFLCDLLRRSFRNFHRFLCRWHLLSRRLFRLFLFRYFHRLLFRTCGFLLRICSSRAL